MPASRHKFALALVCGLPFVSMVFVGLRLYTRYFRRIRFGWDDVLLIAANLLAIGLIYPSIRDIQIWHRGYHIWEVAPTTAQSEPNLVEWYHILLSVHLLNVPILPLAKASIILILLRVGKIITLVRRCLYGILAFNVGACVIPWAVLIFICPPRTGNTWAATTFGGLQCLGRDEQGATLLFINCANLVTDLLIFPIPFFIMRELMNTDVRARVAIILTFASSLCVTGLSAAKIYVTYRDRISLISKPDWTYSIEFCISHGEANVGIIVACLPQLRGLFSSRSQRCRQTSFSTAGDGLPSTAIRHGSNGSAYAMTRKTPHSPSFHDDDQLLKPNNVFVTTHMSVDIESRGARGANDEHGETHRNERHRSDDTGAFSFYEHEHSFNTTPALPPVHVSSSR